MEIRSPYPFLNHKKWEKVLIILFATFLIYACHNTTRTSHDSSAGARLKPVPFSVRQGRIDAGMGHRVINFIITNKTDSAISMYGYPDITLLDSLKRPYTNIKVLKSGSSYFRAFRSPEHISLQPDSIASFEFSYDVIRVNDHPCPKVSYISFQLPGDTNTFIFSKEFNPCGGHISVAPIQKGNFLP